MTESFKPSSTEMNQFSTADMEDQIGSRIQTIIREAIQKHVSDIHFEPRKNDYRLRYRIDGVLYDITTIPNHLAIRIATRIKIMGQLDIAEKRLPQDGRIEFKHIHQTTIRLSTCPSIYGEKLVLRLNHSSMAFSLNQLGFLSSQYNLLYSKLINPQGMILVTGPTGSGKTITLYSALKILNTSENNIITIEDPVEIELPNTTQIQINNLIGLSFSSILRSVLRQDPDIIMLGEIRDQETARLAIHAANTGHLVFATLHANHAYEALTRLQTLGLSSEHIIDSLTLVIAQRLVRKLCLHCKLETSLTPNHPLRKFCASSRILFEANGCDQCHRGYYGQTAIYEMLYLSDELISLLTKQTSKQAIIAHLQEHQWISLHDACLEKIFSGVTSYQEYLRILGGVHALYF